MLIVGVIAVNNWGHLIAVDAICSSLSLRLHRVRIHPTLNTQMNFSKGYGFADDRKALN